MQNTEYGLSNFSGSTTPQHSLVFILQRLRQDIILSESSQNRVSNQILFLINTTNPPNKNASVYTNLPTQSITTLQTNHRSKFSKNRQSFNRKISSYFPI